MPRLSKIGSAALAAFGWTSSTGAVGVTASYLIVAGGGGSGWAWGGGGGAGGYQTGTTSLTLASSYTVTVGAGGSAGTSTANSSTQGSNTSFGALTASVGGGRGSGASDSSPYSGGSGGSGGGAVGAGATGFPASGGAGTAGQGNAGGSVGANPSGGAGGGGAGAVGASTVQGTPSNGGNGGVGLTSSISGTSTYYAGGGGGGTTNASGATSGTGGLGGGGNGSSGVGNSGSANTGGGAGGGGYNGSNNNGANGGSGIVIISYAGAQQFGGGVVTSVGGNTIHTFTTSGTLSPLSSLSASYLIVAGGGGGGASTSGANSGSGAGAGGLLSGSGTVIDTASTYLVTVGAGGAGASSGTTSNGTQGSSSVFSIIATTAVGGGSGANNLGTGTGGNGGSGGGSAGTAAGTATAGQGNAGGTSTSSGLAGGGGAGAVGGNATGTATGGNGGAGSASSISGTSVTYAGGGGGGGNTTAGTGGAGGGGAGGQGGTLPSSGTANTGGGGGGGNGNTISQAGGSGGSGVVIISYAGSTQQMAGGSVTITGGNVIHTFTTSGYLTPLTYYSNSLRFRASNSAYLTRTPTVTSNQKTWTWSGWVKLGVLGTSEEVLFSTSSQRFVLSFATDQLYAYWFDGTTYPLDLYTTQKFRDPASWYHIVLAIDTTQATASNRAKIYVNGTQVTAFVTATYPSLNDNLPVNSTTEHNIGRRANFADRYFDGYLTNIQLIDGQALTPNSFGTFNSIGVWQPINYGGSYGTNGFLLPFSNTTSTTTLGYDFSPNGNNWTPTNISVTAGSTYDAMTDVPTLTSATAANYCTLNPLSNLGNGTISSGNLNYVSSSAAWQSGAGTIFPSTGKWYFEVTLVQFSSSFMVGVVNTSFTSWATYMGASAFGWALQGTASGTGKWNNNSSASLAAGEVSATGNVFMVAYDVDAAKIWFGKSGTWYASGDPAAGTNAAYTNLTGSIAPAVSTSTTSDIVALNCGQRPFVYTPPTGFVRLNTFNL
jgi:hypothetical protein